MVWTALFDTLNRAGLLLERAGLGPPRYDPEALLTKAVERTGLEDFGDEAFREPYRRVVEAYDSAAHLTPLGRLAARIDLLRLLTNRLRLVEDRRAHPGIAEVEIRRPIFIVSLPRTGTTLLHGLLSRDPALRTPRSWEVMYPSPPPDRERAGPDPRIARVRREFRWFHRMAPGYRVAHPVGPELPQECMAITEHTFDSPRFDRTHRLEAYRDWLDGRDREHAYRFHRCFLQHLSWRGPRGRWVLKNPPHSFWLEALYRVYPDACFVQTHREPLTVAASFASHNARLRRAFTLPADAREGPVVAERWARGMERLTAFRDRPDVPADRWVDIHYPELLEDPLGQVRRIYDRFGLPLRQEVEEAMRAFLREHPRHEHGVHRYSLGRFGLDPDRHGPLFDAYRRRFDVRRTEEDERLLEGAPTVPAP